MRRLPSVASRPELESDRDRYAYVYAVALYTSDRVDDAIKTLKENLARHPDDRNTLLALVTFNRIPAISKQPSNTLGS